ncbi:retrovirus-related Pol polyprotein from transposon RE1 [Trichonephila clavipes]|uniref:Retrovirus-related Pol polyprotein from transposon RE1 n=1 Tax=Trichonephila clavipes TaxID=2585209 RepID=A0A8X6T3Z9_TRICX|nr:retrovirus-related Pol polyprotein from transposon RE1 [Trichonephila clavipes]
MGIMMGYAQRTKGYRIWLIDENKLVETINERFDENKRGINFRQKVNSNLGYNLNLPDYYDDEDHFDRVKDSLTSRLVSKTSMEMPSTSEKPDVSSDNHSLIPCTEVKWIRNIGRKVTGSNKDNTESQGFSDLSEQQEALMVEVTIPNCYKQAIRSRDASKWHDAMDKEINLMKERKVWDLVDHPDNIKILENRWVYTIKYDENNKIVRYKARLVARVNTQLRGESFDKVISPVINFTIVRLFFTICVCLWKWTHIQVDITNAYLYANLDTVIYMKQPTGYEIDNNKVCKLRKAIYGLHQSGRQWFLELENKLIKLKFKKLEWVNCVYMFEGNVILLFYVDDMIIFGIEMENVNFVLQLLQKNFETSEENLTVPYRNLIGSLSFIAIRTRPDIMYAVNVLSQFQANPRIKHWNCLLRLLGYLKYTQEYKLELSKVKLLKLRCYSDSDFATNRDDQVSMGGFITFIDETPISWRTFKQKSVSLSTMEAEYVSLTEAAKEFIWLKNVIDNKSLNLELSENVMFCDNQAAISFSKSPVENYRTKHIDVRYHFLRNLIYKVFQIKYIGTKIIWRTFLPNPW